MSLCIYLLFRITQQMRRVSKPLLVLYWQAFNHSYYSLHHKPHPLCSALAQEVFSLPAVSGWLIPMPARNTQDDHLLLALVIYNHTSSFCKGIHVQERGHNVPRKWTKMKQILSKSLAVFIWSNTHKHFFKYSYTAKNNPSELPAVPVGYILNNTL